MIVQAHLVGLEQGAAPLCIHYQPDTLTLGRVRELVQSVGADLTALFAHLVIRGDSTLHARAARNAADSLRSVSGAPEADASASGTLRIEYDRAVVSETVLRARADELGIRSAPESGAPAAPGPGSADHGTGRVAHDKNASHFPAAHAAHPAHAAPHEAADDDHIGHDHAHDHDHAKAGKGSPQHGHAHGGPFGEKSELVFSVLAGFLLLAGRLVEQFDIGAAWRPTACCITAYFLGGN